MKYIVSTKKQIKEVLEKNGLTSTPLPTLPVTIKNISIECNHKYFEQPDNAGKGLTEWFEICKCCGSQRKTWYSDDGIHHTTWK